ncbi:LysM peptidoglycan-binding domain-containing protein [Massilia sp. Se16.2.3]|uniref:M23 family metallopeptidase n=1 Tax=Massilia sp. Se16.2.3 TaxID=2709303 RepID=UPI002805C3BF|nr:LysM peptidoglycan-binding domain-containing protein [Massilia sp. Se16.2.3]
MKQRTRLALLTLTFGLVAGCTSTTRQAPIVERPMSTSSSQSRPAPVRTEERKDARGTYTVRRGDTLVRIALDHGQNYRDLVTWNNLADPDDIKVGQVLRVLPNERESKAVVTQPVPMPPENRPSVPRKTTPRADKKPYEESVAEAPRDKAGGAGGKCRGRGAGAGQPGDRRPRRCHRERHRRREAELDVAVRRAYHRYVRRRQEQGDRHRGPRRPAGDGGRCRQSNVRW